MAVRQEVFLRAPTLGAPPSPRLPSRATANRSVGAVSVRGLRTSFLQWRRLLGSLPTLGFWNWGHRDSAIEDESGAVKFII